MALEKQQEFWTLEEYLAYELETGIKHEYIDGEIFAMSGGSDKHSLIKTNCVVELGLQLRGKQCRLYDNDMKVKITNTKYVYPDFSVVCGSAEFDDESNTMLINPTLVAEVTSPSSESYDRVTKADFCRSLASIQAYLIIKQEKVQAQLYTRHDDGWFLRDFTSLEDIIPLDTLGCSLPMSEIYRDIDYSASEAAASDSA